MQAGKAENSLTTQKEEGEKMIVEVLAIILAFILGIIVGATIIIGIALYIERKDKNGDKKEG